MIDPASKTSSALLAEANETLDPTDWTSFRAQAHRMLDDMLGYIETIRERPVWQPVPDEVRAHFRSPAPRSGADLAQVHAEFMREVLPYAQGNVHPGFMGWVNGGGTPVGMVAEMLAGGLNANLGGRNHMGAGDLRISRRRKRTFCYWNLDGQPDRRAHCPRCGIGRRGARRRRGSRPAAAHRIHLDRGA
jgi:hypothetical protein